MEPRFRTLATIPSTTPSGVRFCLTGFPVLCPWWMAASSQEAGGREGDAPACGRSLMERSRGVERSPFLLGGCRLLSNFSRDADS